MVRQVMTKQASDWKALLAIAVATGALLWHLLACTESPMAFSPDGKDLAFVTMEPYDDEALELAGTRVYRLMVLSEGKKLRVLEETTDFMLTAPGYSPDGKYLCYARIPLLTRKDAERLKQHFKERTDGLDKSDSFVWDEEPAPPTSSAPAVPASQPARSVEVLMMPPFEASVELAMRQTVDCFVPATLVVRNAATHGIVSTTSFEWPLGRKPDEELRMTYLTTHPQYGPDGKWVYLCIDDIVMAVDPSSGDERIYAMAANGLLSPDGETMAILLESAVGFIRTDGQTVTYRRLAGELSRSGMAWVDKNKLAVLARTKEEDEGEKDVLYFVRTDGTVVATQTLPLPQHKHGEDHTGELAIAPDGTHMVLAYGEDVFFMRRDGSVREHWQGDDGRLLAQPTFAPNSKHVAMKYMQKKSEPYPRVSAIVFFTPEGKESSRVTVPRIDPATTQPALPSTQPAH